MPGVSPQLGSLLRGFPRGAALAAEVELACREPARYVSKYRERLALRGVEAPVRELARIALVDGLIARGKAAEIDHREEPDRILAALRRLLPVPKRRALPTLEEVASLNPSSEALLRVVSRRLEGVEIALVAVSLGGDSYPVLALPAERAAPFIAASACLGRRCRRVRGLSEVGLTRAAAREQARLAQRRARTRQAERSAGKHGQAWARLVQTHGSLASAIFALRYRYERARHLLIEAAPEAPPRERPRALAVAALLTDPERAAREHAPKLVVDLLGKIPQSPQSTASRVACLVGLEKRLKPASSPQAMALFLQACQLHHADMARQLVPKTVPAATLERWQKLMLSQLTRSKNQRAFLALGWLGDGNLLQGLLKKTPAPGAGKRLTIEQKLVYSLAKAQRHTLKGWPRR